MPSLATPAAVCAASLRLHGDVRGDRGIMAVAARSISRSRAARAVLASSSSDDLRACLRRRRAAGWRRGGWELASIACRALSASNEEGEEEGEEEQSRGDGNADDQNEELDAADDDENVDEAIADVDNLFAALAAQRRGESLFREEMSKPDETIDLARAAGYVAMHRRPDESRVADAVEELDALAAELEATLPPPDQRYPLRTLKAISRYMFHTLGFKGNEEEFYDPRNSCLDEVLARRTGIPITLSLVYMELARRVGVPMVGVNLPAHFMIRPVVEDMEVLVDCFNDGELKFVEDVEDMLKKFYAMGEKDTLTIDRSFFADNSMKPRAFLTRMLTNLKQIYFNNDEFAAALQIVAYQAHCAPDEKVALFNRRDGGICLFLMQRHAEAVEELSGFLAECDAKGMWDGDGNPTARAQIAQMIEHAKAQVARESVKRSVEDALGEAADADDPKARDDP